MLPFLSPFSTLPRCQVRSSIDLGSQVRTSTPVIKSPLALETDFSAVSPSSTTPKTSTSEGKTTEAHKSQVRRQEPIPSQDPPSQPVVSLDDTEALLATLDAKNGQSAIEATTDLSALNELEVPTMTDAEVSSTSLSLTTIRIELSLIS